jgi:2-haloacid dehalogenase
MNVVFDLGNVLIRWDPRLLYRKLMADEARIDWFLANICTAQWNLVQDAGRPFSLAVTELSAQYPEHADLIRVFDTRWHETLGGAIEGSVAILRELDAVGTPLYAITNWNDEKFRETRPQHEFLALFRDIVVSGEERLVKPDPAIFRLLLERQNLRAEECFFIDDSLANIETARAVGMTAHHFVDPDGLRRELRAMQLLKG